MVTHLHLELGLRKSGTITLTFAIRVHGAGSENLTFTFYMIINRPLAKKTTVIHYTVSFVLHPLFEQRIGENISFRTLGVLLYSVNKVGVMSSAKLLRLSCSEPLGHKPNSVGDSPHCSSGLIHPHYPKICTTLVRKAFGNCLDSTHL